MRLQIMAADLTFQDSIAISQLFEYKGWLIDEKNKSSLFNRFLRTYRKMENEERKLFINLSYRYEVISLNQYQLLLTRVLSKMVKNHLGQRQTVYVYPIKKKEHQDCVKSADLVTYLCNGTNVRYVDELSKKDFICLGSMNRVEEKLQNIAKSKLVIIDDFIGSGTYATDVVNEIEALGIPAEQIVIVALFITPTALDKLKKLQCSVEYGEIVEPCISELTPSEKEILTQMEQKMGVNSEFSFGYCQSGALISLIRTPNNTLPIFWHSNGRASAPPFPR